MEEKGLKISGYSKLFVKLSYFVSELHREIWLVGELSRIFLQSKFRKELNETKSKSRNCSSCRQAIEYFYLHKLTLASTNWRMMRMNELCNVKLVDACYPFVSVNCLAHN